MTGARGTIRRAAPRRAVRPAAGSGFTLVEVLLALALTLLLMGAVYLAFDMYRQLSTTGRQEAEQSQIVRAIHRKMTVDLRSIVFQPPSEEDEGEEPAAEDGDGEEAPAEETVIEIVDPGDAVATTTTGVIGDGQSLVLHISRPPRGLAYTPPDTGRPLSGQSSDLVSVTYLLASPEAGGLHAAVAQATGKSGLARLAGDRLAMDTADEGGNLDQLAATAVLLAEEVNYLQFRYFDGSEWYDSWDSTQSGTLPRAIEVTLGLKPLPVTGGEDEQTNSSATTEQSTKTYTFLIALPLADPTPPEAELGL